MLCLILFCYIRLMFSRIVCWRFFLWFVTCDCISLCSLVVLHLGVCVCFFSFVCLVWVCFFTSCRFPKFAMYLFFHSAFSSRACFFRCLYTLSLLLFFCLTLCKLFIFLFPFYIFLQVSHFFICHAQFLVFSVYLPLSTLSLYTHLSLSLSLRWPIS